MPIQNILKKFLYLTLTITKLKKPMSFKRKQTPFYSSAILLMSIFLILLTISCKRPSEAPIPAITGFSPSEGFVGDAVTITGTNFELDKTKNVIKFGSISAVVNSATATELKTVVPAGAVTDRISVTINGTTFFSPTNFTVKTIPIPTFTGFSPSSALEDDTLTLTGTNFDPDRTKNIVTIGALAATVLSANPTEIKVVVPKDAVRSRVNIRIGTTNLSSANELIVNSIYIAGFEGGVAKYWKNGKPVNITDGTLSAQAEDIVVVGSDVYTTGSEGNEAKYWKNSTATTLPSPTISSGLSIAVSGNDVHVVGLESFPGQEKAKYWKNGVNVPLSDGEGGVANAVRVVGSDVYIAGAGAAGSGSSFSRVVQVWKNGIVTKLTTPATSPAVAMDMVVSGQDVYVAGYELIRPKYVVKLWKNGIGTNLTNGVVQARPSGIFLVGNDVYVAGIEGDAFTSGAGKYWKNGRAVTLTDGSKLTRIEDIVVSGNNVIVVGSEGGTGARVAKYWRNGRETVLTNGTMDSGANSVFIAP
jgi:hypothetical protein